MEEDIDIYADLPNFSLKVDRNEEQVVCNCEELRKELSKLKSKYEGIQHVNKNLEGNMASLLKTAKVEIARKDRIIGDLRKQLDDIAFRRNNSDSQQNSLSFYTRGSSRQQCTVVEKHENVVSSTYSDENEVISYPNEIYDEEHECEKLQNDTNRIPVTVFGERLRKKIIDEEKEEKRTLSKLNAETNIRKIPKVAESDKENGSQLSINNINESNAVTRNSNLETSCKRNTGKRPNNEDDTRGSKRLKTEDNNDKTTGDDTDSDYIARYDARSDFAKFEDRTDAMHSIKKEQVPLSEKHRDATDDITKQDQSTNKWKREVRSSSGRDCDVSRIGGRSADGLRNCWVASKSNGRPNNERQYDYYINDYKKKSYRCDSPSSRSYSRSRNDYKSSSNHRLWEISGKTYKGRRHEDYKYNNRRGNDKFGRDYSSNEHDNNRKRYNNRERSDLRDRLKYLPNDIDKEMRNNYNKSNKHDSRKTKVPADFNTKETKEASLLLQTNSKNTDHGVATRLNSSSRSDATVNEMRDHNNHNGTRKSCSDENLMDSVARNIQTTLITIERVRDSNTEDENCTNSVKEDFKNSHIENVAIIEEVNNFNIDDNVCKIDGEALTDSIATRNEVVPNCDANKDSTLERSRVSLENDTPSQISYKSNGETSHSCLNDHNYVRYVTMDAIELDVVQKPSMKSECKTMPENAEIATSKETRTKETVSVQSAGAKKTTSSTLKSKKEQSSKPVVILRRRKAVTLSDNKASMTVLMNTDTAKASSVVKNSINDNSDPVSKPRACKHARICKSGL